MESNKQELQKHSKVCQHIYDVNTYVNLVAARQVKILGFTSKQHLDTDKVESIHEDHINLNVTGRCLVKFLHDGKYLDKILYDFVYKK